MPDIKTLCRDLEIIREAINALATRMQRLEMQAQMSDALNKSTGAQAPLAPSVSGGGAGPLPPPQAAQSPAAESDVQKSGGDLPEVIPTHVSALEKSIRKNKGGGTSAMDRIEELEGQRFKSDEEKAVQRAMQDMEFHFEGMRLDSIARQTKEKDERAEIERMISEAKAEMKEDLKRVRQEIKDQARLTKLESSDLTADALGRIFGIRFMRKISPEGLAPFFDMKSISNNVRFVDRQLQNGINKSLAAKVSAGKITMEEAGEAGGFFSSELVGAQVGAGALIGLYLFENIPTIVKKITELSEFKDSVRSIIMGDPTFNDTASLQKASAWLNSWQPARDASFEYAKSRATLGQESKPRELQEFFAKIKQVKEDDLKLSQAVESYQRNKALASMGFRGGMLKGLLDGFGIR